MIVSHLPTTIIFHNKTISDCYSEAEHVPNITSCLPLDQAASGDEQVDDAPMDAQSPGGNNDSGAAETPPDPRLLEMLKEDPPIVYSPMPVQELRHYCQRLNQHKKETEEAADLMESLCRENEEKDKYSL